MLAGDVCTPKKALILSINEILAALVPDVRIAKEAAANIVRNANLTAANRRRLWRVNI
jgi:hypothetical protein